MQRKEGECTCTSLYKRQYTSDILDKKLKKKTYQGDCNNWILHIS